MKRWDKRDWWIFILVCVVGFLLVGNVIMDSNRIAYLQDRVESLEAEATDRDGWTMRERVESLEARSMRIEERILEEEEVRMEDVGACWEAVNDLERHVGAPITLSPGEHGP